MKYYYKITSRTGRSVVPLSSSYQLRYNIGKTTKPNIGKLFVFGRLKNALMFIKNNPLLINASKIFRVLAKKPEGAMVICDAHKPRYWKGFWEKGICLRPSHFSTPPAGTYVADSVKVISDVGVF